MFPYDAKDRRRLSTGKTGRQTSPAGTHSSSNVSAEHVAKTTDLARYDSLNRNVSSFEEGGEIRKRPDSLPAKKVSSVEVSDSDDDEEDERRFLEIPTLSRLKTSESVGSLSSMYSALGGKGDYAISGEVLFGVSYSRRDGLLLIHVDQARNIAATRKDGYSYPYVKVYLLPDRTKQTKRKTGFVRRTVNPKYDETFKVHVLCTCIYMYMV